jgi:hypothetical protein
MKSIKTTNLVLAAIAVALFAAGTAMPGMPLAQAQLSELVAQVEETVAQEEAPIGHTLVELGELVAGEE